MVSGRHRNRKHHLIGVFLPILFDLLLRQGCKILISNSDYKKGAADNVIRYSGFICQGTVHRQSQKLALSVTDEHDRVIERVNSLNISTYDPLQALNEKLDDRFLQPHRSFIVSMPHIRAFYYDHLILDNDLEIMLSRKKRNELKKQYQDYLCRITRERG